MNRQHLFLTAAALFAAVSCALRAYGDKPIEVGEPETVHHRINPHFEFAPPKGGETALSPIIYHNGPVMPGQVNAYVIWYGNWTQFNGSDTPAGQDLVRSFLRGIGGSPYMGINKSYSVGSTLSTLVTGGVTFGGETTVVGKGPQAKKLGDRDIASIVQTAIQTGLPNGLPRDPNGVYFVLTSSDVSETSGFCTRYCGWHTHGSMLGSDIKYSFVGNANRCLNACSMQLTSPNGNPGVDAMISVIAHELEEAISDPDLNAWYDASGAENADKCAWTFGNTARMDSGAFYNVILNDPLLKQDFKFLIQRNLYHGPNNSGDFCAMWVNGGVVQQTSPNVTPTP